MSAAKDHVGEKIGMLDVLKRKRENNRTYYFCRCDCGNEKWVRAETLNSNNPSCGCAGRFKPKDIKDKQFGRLTAKYPTDKRDKDNGSVIWMCSCSCGNSVEVAEYRLVKEEIVSCGCYRAEVNSKYGKDLGEKTKTFCIEGTNVRNLTAKIPKNNTSGFKGVSWDKSRCKWAARIIFKGKYYYLGRYHKKEDAIEVRRIAENKLFGDFLKWYEEEYKKAKED